MPNRALVIHELETVPEPLLGEVLDFIEFVKAKSIREGLYTAIASESSLKKDWLCAEEEEAWGDLTSGPIASSPPITILSSTKPAA